jgi:acetyl esterase
MELWSDEIDAMRPEARQVVAAGLSAMAEAFAGRDEPPADAHAAALHSRASFAATYAPVPEGVEREIAGVRCRTFIPDGPVTALYLHFHGGGMILGAPEMNDSGNLDLCRRFGLAVISVDYRLAPEHPFPAGPDDGVAVAAWLVQRNASGGPTG